MFKEIKISDTTKLVMFRDYNFWERILPESLADTTSLDIVTYNFNFKDRFTQSFYEKLNKLAENGVNVRLIYSKSTFDTDSQYNLDNNIKNLILTANLKENHSKMLVTDNQVYLGSANFSFHSNCNYESGVLITDRGVVKQVREEFITELLNNAMVINYPEQPNLEAFTRNKVMCLIDKLLVNNKLSEQVELILELITMLLKIKTDTDYADMLCSYVIHPANISTNYNELKGLLVKIKESVNYV